IDERGSLTFAEVDRRTNALARSMADAGIGEGDGVAIMCRDHHWFIEATVAISKLGANTLLFNTAVAGPQLKEVTDGGDPAAIVPVMLQRILELDHETRGKHDLSSLRVVASSGGALDGELSERWMDEFGDNLYNLYGSTEVAWAAIAEPDDMRAAPGTSGKPP